METIVFLSPHYDDAVLSFGHLIQKLKEDGHRIVIVTVFTQAQPERWQENQEALSILGAEAFELDFTDAPQRQQKILFSSPARDPETKEQLTQAFAKLPLLPDRVFAPLGIGWHIDHLLVHEASLGAFPGKLWFYEDSPYNFSAAQCELRFSASADAMARFKQEFFELRYVRAWLSDWDEGKLADQLGELTLCSKELGVAFTCKASLDERKSRAIKAYKSQWPFLFHNEDEVSLRAAKLPERYYFMKTKFELSKFEI